MSESHADVTLRRIRQAAEFCQERATDEYGTLPPWCRCDTILRLLNEAE